MTRAECLQTAEKEEWRAVPGEGHDYLISSAGRVKSLKRTIVRSNGRPQTFRERILKLSCDEWGYPQARINGRTFKIHRAVALAFLGERAEGTEIRHLDGNPKNNNIENLIYGTHSENVMDGYSYAGKIRRNQKLTLKSVIEIKAKISHGAASVDIAKEYGISQQSVCDIKHARIYGHVPEGGTV